MESAKAKVKKAEKATGVAGLSKKDLICGLDKAKADYKIAALTKKEDKILYDYIESSDQILWEYTPTVLSPKKFLFPREEVILNYTPDGDVQPNIQAESQVLFGIRPCDLNGIKIMNEAFAESKGDPNYLAKKEKTVVIGLDCKELCNEDAFCYRVKSNYTEAGFDIMLTDLGDEFAMEIATPQGQAFVDKYLTSGKVDSTKFEKYSKEKKKNFSKVPPFSKLDQFPEIFEKSKDHIIWEDEGAKCLSCGSCIMVCPTCYCFDVADDLALNLKSGTRIRRWDACMLSPFATVAGGENFRHEVKNRIRHRINRKFNYLMKKHGQSVCVGCGRCVRACLAEINPKRIAKIITGEKE
ncbi:MAG: 4Fe-4S dicluster domain-containing protein [Candidatus Margulisbacteria bacterium]|nr:4Fe-4S dicluster domain-containing protein [Candidatus Margulisiibacteriota bacterium]